MSPPATIKANTSPYGGDRWGDYSQVNADPSNLGVFWSHHEYSPGGGSWYTWVQSETISDPAASPEPGLERALSALRAYPNPTSGATTLRFSLADPSELRLAVYDTNGRRVAGWGLGSRPAGRGEVRWDSRDDSGRPVPNGVYSVVITRSGNPVASGRVTVAR
jgi:hypothetical protein